MITFILTLFLFRQTCLSSNAVPDRALSASTAGLCSLTLI